uniref:Uncharacterized protein n=1 Tax=Rhizophora mucronata TaxID=61149 RepID=A0A2P2QCQ9_RHIMU
MCLMSSSVKVEFQLLLASKCLNSILFYIMCCMIALFSIMHHDLIEVQFSEDINKLELRDHDLILVVIPIHTHTHIEEFFVMFPRVISGLVCQDRKLLECCISYS